MSHCYRFDRFELRAGERVLYAGGEPVTLGARAVDLLLALVGRSGRMVSKNELIDLVWPGRVVTENNLQVQISTLRKLLGQESIATIPGRGYRFALPLARNDGSEESRRSGLSDEPVVLAPSTNVWSALPSLPGRLLGRDCDLMALAQERHHPLITIFGAGGIGKTAFALAAAHEWCRDHRHGAVWVELAGITDPLLVVSAVSQAMGLSSGGADPMAALVTALKPLQLLLVIDNAEHLQDAVIRLTQAITAGAPDVRLLVTSQAALKLHNERVFRLGPLSVPGIGTPATNAVEHGAVALFIDQAQAVDRGFVVTDSNVDAVIALCTRLDGMALAIKLAAAQLPMLGLQGILDRLDERFKLLRGHSSETLPRKQTLLGTLEWSHALLSPAAQRVFRRLAVFAGGFTLQLAGAVALDELLDEWAVIELLGSLVDYSLVAADGADVPRYRLLESAREYAGLQLDLSGEYWLMKRRHVSAMAALMEQAYLNYWTMPDAVWLEMYSPEIDNVRVALDWMMAHEPTLAVDMIGASSFLFLLLGLAAEFRKRCVAVETHVVSMRTSRAVSRYWAERSRLHWGVSNTLMHEFACRAASQSLALEDNQGRYMALGGVAGSGVVPIAHVHDFLEEMIRLEQPNWPLRLRMQRQLATVSVMRSAGQLGQAKRVCEVLLTQSQAHGLDVIASAALADLAGLSLAVGESRAAIRHCRELLAHGRHRRDNIVLQAMAVMAAALFMQKEVEQARGALVVFAEASRSRGWEWFDLYSALFALLAALEGRHETAARVLGYAERAQHQLGPRDTQVAQALEQAHGMVNALLSPAMVIRLSQEGAQMAPSTVCSWALARVDR